MDRVSVEEMEELERLMVEKYRVSSEVLMELAGERIADVIRERFSGNLKIAFICGKGGNGGDGFVAARRLESYGYDVQAYTPFEEKELSRLTGRKMKSYNEVGEMSIDFPSANVYVDALLGYRMEGELREPVSETVEKLNDWSTNTVSIDVPTGLNVREREVVENSVRPELTICIGVLKHGMTENNSGDIVLVDVGIPVEAFEELDLERPRFDGSRFYEIDK